MYNEYGASSLMKLIAWTCGVILSVLIIASRKHYTVDILIAWCALREYVANTSFFGGAKGDRYACWLGLDGSLS